MRGLREHTQSKKFDLEWSSYVGQINHTQNADLKIAIISGGLLFVINFRMEATLGEVRGRIFWVP